MSEEKKGKTFDPNTLQQELDMSNVALKQYMTQVCQTTTQFMGVLVARLKVERQFHVEKGNKYSEQSYDAAVDVVKDFIASGEAVFEKAVQKKFSELNHLAGLEKAKALGKQVDKSNKDVN